MSTPLEDYCKAIVHLVHARDVLNGDRSSLDSRKENIEYYKECCQDIKTTLLALLRDEEQERKRNDIC